MVHKKKYTKSFISTTCGNITCCNNVKLVNVKCKNVTYLKNATWRENDTGYRNMSWCKPITLSPGSAKQLHY